MPRIVPDFIAAMDVSGPRYRTFSPPSLTVTMSGSPSLLTSATTTSVVLGVIEPGYSGALITMGVTAEKSLGGGLLGLLLPGLR